MFCWKGVINLIMGVDVEMGWGGGGGLPLFCYLTVQFSHIYSVCVCGGGGASKVSLYYFLDLQSFDLAMQDFHPRSH